MAFYRGDRGFWVADLREGKKRVLLKIDARSKEHAEQIEHDAQKRFDDKAKHALPDLRKSTFGAIIETWIERRARAGKQNVESERTHLRHHLLPILGDVPLAKVTEDDAILAVERLIEKGLAPRTVKNIHGTAASLWQDYKREIPVNPWRAAQPTVPDIHDRDPEWREASTFNHEELEQLISDPEIPAPRRMVNALLGLAGLRIGEAAALCWRHYAAAYTPLGRLTIAWSHDRRTKTKDTRFIPVHPTLASVLDDWRLHGWVEQMGREPTDDDLIVPGPPGPRWSDRAFRDRFQGDLERLGLRVKAGTMGQMRSPHGLRASFLTLAVEDGAIFEIIDRVEHRGGRRGAGHMYLRPSWELMCREVAKLRIGATCYQNATGKNAGAETLEVSPTYEIRGEGGGPSPPQRHTGIERGGREGPRPSSPSIASFGTAHSPSEESPSRAWLAW